ncbi:MAG TPA: hypothetical protein VEB66_00915 [Opitutaceae bacterium]|nr:hypothetical protein [Opitutaceae bacterium]
MSPVAKLLALGLASACLMAPAFGQRQLGRRTTPTAKFFVAEVKGESQITSGERVHEGRQASAYDAPGTVIETKADSHSAVVYSNGTGMFVDSDTRVEIERFSQEPFVPSQYTPDAEPSITQSNIFVSRGFVGVCTGQLVSGSTMSYSTAHAAVNVRGRKIGIRTSPEETVIYLLEGDVTVRSDARDFNGHVLRPGEQAVVRPGAAGQPASVTISPIPSDVMASLDERVTVACNARRTVSFETIDRAADGGGEGDGESQEIVARPTVEAEVPTNLVVSPDRLPGT